MKENSIYRDLSDWFFKAKVNEVLSYEVIGQQIKKIRLKWGLLDRAVTLGDLTRWITACREDMERRYKTTLYNIKGIGYKISSPDELALYTAKFFKRTIMFADRTHRLANIVDRKRIPAAIKKVFADAEGSIKNLSVEGEKYMHALVGYLHDQKMIEHKGGDNGKA